MHQLKNLLLLTILTSCSKNNTTITTFAVNDYRTSSIKIDDNNISIKKSQ